MHRDASAHLFSQHMPQEPSRSRAKRARSAIEPQAAAANELPPHCQRVFKMMSTGEYEAKARTVIEQRQQALDGLSQQPEPNLVGLGSLLVEGRRWTKNLRLASLAKTLVERGSQQDRPNGDVVRGSAEVGEDLAAALARLTDCEVGDEAFSGQVAEVSRLTKERKDALEAERQSQKFATDQAICLEEVMQLLEDDIQAWQRKLEQAIAFHEVISDGELL